MEKRAGRECDPWRSQMRAFDSLWTIPFSNDSAYALRALKEMEVENQKVLWNQKSEKDLAQILGEGLTAK
jgi:hypothetical protein